VNATEALERRLQDLAGQHRIVWTDGRPGSHVAAYRKLAVTGIGGFAAHGFGKLVCGQFAGGVVEAMDLDRVDCLGCVDAYLAAALGRSVTVGPLGAGWPVEVRCPLITP
jgi:hypothetical protein